MEKEALKKELIHKLYRERDLSDQEFAFLLEDGFKTGKNQEGDKGQEEGKDQEENKGQEEGKRQEGDKGQEEDTGQEGSESDELLFSLAKSVCQEHFHGEVYLRGLIEFTNHCKNDCLYCGIRRSNPLCERYRLSQEEILSCCKKGYELGLRTFVLQGGEDGYFTKERLTQLIRSIKGEFPDCALTLSVGERDKETYEAWFEAGADRYLLRHETANPDHYGRLHPPELSLQNRIRCLYDLKEIGYQVGAGMMVGSPHQTPEDLVADLRLLKSLRPQMIGIGPFLPHKDTPFRGCPPGSAKLTLRLLGILRLLFPEVLLPATTALGTGEPRGRQKGLLSGANVIMPNLTPSKAREKYLLYDGKVAVKDKVQDSLDALRRDLEGLGFSPSYGRGDAPGWKRVLPLEKERDSKGKTSLQGP